jgi:catechol 2,3-dioxygenase-like lactoylglutathione lyase family enzyme
VIARRRPSAIFASVFHRVTIRAADLAAAERFYTAVLPALGIPRTHAYEQAAEWQDFAVVSAGDGTPVTRRLHIGFVAPSHAEADAFWRAGTEAGYRDDGAPGPRPEYGADYYGAFLLDPDGNSAEAVHHDSLRRGGAIDHLWIRVADVAAATRFYEMIAPYAGLHLRTDTPGRAQFKGDGGSFSVVSGDAPTEHVQLAFRAPDEATVDAFHGAAIEGGYHDGGGPGERDGSYRARVLDPDGNTVELLFNHNQE